VTKPRDDRDDRIGMWAGVGAGALALLVLAGVTAYGYSQGVFA